MRSRAAIPVIGEIVHRFWNSRARRWPVFRGAPAFPLGTLSRRPAQRASGARCRPANLATWYWAQVKQESGADDGRRILAAELAKELFEQAAKEESDQDKRFADARSPRSSDCRARLIRYPAPVILEYPQRP